MEPPKRTNFTLSLEYWNLAEEEKEAATRAEDAAFFLDFVAGGLVGGLKEGDLELFTGEPYKTVEPDLGRMTEQYLKKHPDFFDQAYAFKDSEEIFVVSDLLKYFEDYYAYGVKGDVEAEWKHILDLPELEEVLTFVDYETKPQMVERILRIKRKLERLPRLDERGFGPDRYNIYVNLMPGHFHPLDKALLAALGMRIGIVVISEEDNEEDYSDYSY